MLHEGEAAAHGLRADLGNRGKGGPKRRLEKQMHAGDDSAVQTRRTFGIRLQFGWT